MESPRVSIGLPVRNGAAHVAASIDSVLSQTFEDFELTICDNASTDGTYAICAAYARRDSRVRLYRNQEDLGAAENFNRSFRLSRGAYFKWLAHDDLLAPSFLDCCVRVMDADLSATLCFPQRVEMTYNGLMLGPSTERHWYEAHPPYDLVSFSRLMRIPERRYPSLVFGLIRSDALRRTGLIRPMRCADLVVVAELRLLGTFRYVPEELFFNRLPEQSPEFREGRRTVRGEALWYDPRGRTRFLMPEWRLLGARLAVVRRCHAPLRSKVVMMFHVLVGHCIVRIPPWVMHRPIRMKEWCYRSWERWSVAAVDRLTWGCIPDRLWSLAHGVRRLDGKCILLALRVPSRRSHGELLCFVARRLSGRPDAHARALLERWKKGVCPLRRTAATLALEPSDGRIAGPSPSEADPIDAPGA